MLANLAKIFAVLAALSALPGTAFAKSARGNAVRHMLQINLAPDSSDKDVCQKIVDSMAFHMRSTQRFTVVDASAPATDHKINVSCVGASIQVTWVAVSKAKGKGRPVPTLVRKIKVRREGSLMNDVEASGLLAAKELLRELPWEGEATSVTAVSAKDRDGSDLILGDPKKGFEQEFVTLSIGYLEAESIGNCVAFDLGTLQATKGRPKFIKIGEGLVIDTRPFSVEAEAYLKKSDLGAEKIYFRIQAPDAKKSQVKRYVRKCKERIGEGSGAALMVGGNPQYPGLASKELIELNMVRQNSGLYLGSYGTTNGLKVPLIVSAYVHNKLEIGEYFDADMRVFRTAYASNYDGPVPDKKAEITFADVFGGIRKNYLEYSAAIGLGLTLDKMNIPYRLVQTQNTATGETKYTFDSVRFYKIRPSFYIAGMADWDDYWLGLRIAVSPSAVSPYTQLNADFNVRLTDTWFIGWDVLAAKVGETSLGEPGGSMINFGGHVGFTIRRARPAMEKRGQ